MGAPANAALGDRGLSRPAGSVFRTSPAGMAAGVMAAAALPDPAAIAAGGFAPSAGRAVTSGAGARTGTTVAAAIAALPAGAWTGAGDCGTGAIAAAALPGDTGAGNGATLLTNGATEARAEEPDRTGADCPTARLFCGCPLIALRS